MRTKIINVLGLGALALLITAPLAAEAHPAPVGHPHPVVHPVYHPPVHFDHHPVYVHRPWVIVEPSVVVGTAPAVDAEYGLRVLALDPAGPGAAAGLQVGDVILTVGGERVETLDALRDATAANAPVDVLFINPTTGQTEDVTVAPQSGLLGVTVDQVPVAPSGNA